MHVSRNYKVMRRQILIASILFIAVSCSNSSSVKQKEVQNPVLVSRLVTNSSGKTYLEVDGKPFLYNSVQAWLPPDGNFDIYMSKALEAGYKIFSLWFPWKIIEPESGQFHFSTLDTLIRQAEKYDMRLDIVWG